MCLGFCRGDSTIILSSRTSRFYDSEEAHDSVCSFLPSASFLQHLLCPSNVLPRQGKAPAFKELPVQRTDANASAGTFRKGHSLMFSQKASWRTRSPGGPAESWGLQCQEENWAQC